MANFLFTKPQRNEIYTKAVELGLDPNPFHWSSYNDSWGSVLPRLDHQPTKSFVRFEYHPAYEGARISIDSWPQIARGEFAQFEDWKTITIWLARWLKAVKLEVETPDLWKAANDQRAWLTSDPGEARNATPFTNQEREIIARHLKTIEDYAVKTYELNEAHQAHVHEQLKYLTDATARVNRFDWKNLAASTFIDIVVTLSLDPDKTEKLLILATQLLGPLVLGATKLLERL